MSSGTTVLHDVFGLFSPDLGTQVRRIPNALINIVLFALIRACVSLLVLFGAVGILLRKFYSSDTLLCILLNELQTRLIELPHQCYDCTQDILALFASFGFLHARIFLVLVSSNLTHLLLLGVFLS